MKLAWAKAVVNAPDNAVIDYNIKQIKYYSEGLSVCESFFIDGNLFWREYRESCGAVSFSRHRDYNAGPALEIFYEDGHLRSQFYYYDGVLHRPLQLGPAAITYAEDGKIFEEYWLAGEKLPDYEIEIECKRYHEVEKLFGVRGISR